MAKNATQHRTIDFGFEDVPLEEKQGRVRGVFDRQTRRAFAAAARPPAPLSATLTPKCCSRG